MDTSRKDRVCVIGAGPSGMSLLYQFGQLLDNTGPEIVCYEKQTTWGGLWNFTWRTGTDKYGNLCHGGMYRHLWINGPKELFEYPDYTFEKHFGKPIPSFPPRPVMRDYLEGRWAKKSEVDLRQFIKFNSVVRNVSYNEATDDFKVAVHDQVTDIANEETFSHVVVAVGIFNVPEVPEILGVEHFTGRVMHSHDFRDANQFKGQRLMVVGSHYSAEDIALQCLKFGAKSIVITWRTKALGFKWPKGIEERPQVQKMDGHVAHFKDGSTTEVDAIILCTGYRYSFPFMEESLRLKSEQLTLYPDNLYKGTLWTKGGNSKLFYIGVQDQYYSFTMFDAQALWTAKYILGKLPHEPQSKATMIEDIKAWIERSKSKANDCHAAIDYQTEFFADLAKEAGYSETALLADDILHTWEYHKDEDIVTYRDRSFSSVFTGTKAPQTTRWFENFDDSIESFIK